jgi:hypothetical protein
MVELTIDLTGRRRVGRWRGRTSHSGIGGDRGGSRVGMDQPHAVLRR